MENDTPTDESPDWIGFARDAALAALSLVVLTVLTLVLLAIIFAPVLF